MLQGKGERGGQQDDGEQQEGNTRGVAYTQAHAFMVKGGRPRAMRDWWLGLLEPQGIGGWDCWSHRGLVEVAVGEH